MSDYYIDFKRGYIRLSYTVSVTASRPKLKFAPGIKHRPSKMDQFMAAVLSGCG